MTVVIMLPTGKAIYENAVTPYMAEQISFQEGLTRAEGPLREFLLKHTREKDLSIFYSIAKWNRPKTRMKCPRSCWPPPS